MQLDLQFTLSSMYRVTGLSSSNTYLTFRRKSGYCNSIHGPIDYVIHKLMEWVQVEVHGWPDTDSLLLTWQLKSSSTEVAFGSQFQGPQMSPPSLTI